MIDALLRVFWNNERERVAPEPIGEPIVGPALQARLEKRLGSTLEELEGDVQRRARAGLPVGRVDEIRDATGRLVGLRPRTYSSSLAAGVDGRLAAMEDAVGDRERDLERRRSEIPVDKSRIRAAEIDLDRARTTLLETRRLAPVSVRWRLLRDFQVLDDLPTPESTPRGQGEGVFSPPAPDSSVSSVVRYDANRIALRQERVAADGRSRDSLRERFDERQAAAVRSLRSVDLSDRTSEKVRLQAKLAEWAEQNPQLARELNE